MSRWNTLLVKVQIKWMGVWNTLLKSVQVKWMSGWNTDKSAAQAGIRLTTWQFYTLLWTWEAALADAFASWHCQCCGATRVLKYQIADESVWWLGMAYHHFGSRAHRNAASLALYANKPPVIMIYLLNVETVGYLCMGLRNQSKGSIQKHCNSNCDTFLLD